MKKSVKIIFHIDLNAFFASVAMIKEPYLKDKVFVVGGSRASSKGVVASASYKARRLGIKSAMAINEVMAIYPRVVVVPLNFNEYKKYSNHFFNLLKEYSKDVLIGSIDEGYIDITKLAESKHPLEIAKEIQDRLYKEYQLPSSIGIAPTLFLAKMASDLKKPLGITVVRKKDIVNKIFPLSIQKLYGVGIKTYPLLEKMGINTIGDFTKKENKDKILTIMKEETYNNFIENILGRSSDVVASDRYAIPKSISNEMTFNYVIDRDEIIFEEIKNLFKTVHKRLKNTELLAKTVTIKLKTTKFKTVTRSKTILEYTDDFEVLEKIVEELFFDNYQEEELRLVGVGLSSIIPKEQMVEEYNLFTYQKFLKG